MDLPFYHTYVNDPNAERSTFSPRWSQPWAWRYWEQTHPDAPPVDGPAPGWRGRDAPSADDLRRILPEPVSDALGSVRDSYWHAWELLFGRNLRRATAANRFPSDFVGTAYNDATFLWDSAFITRFGLYARRIWPVVGTLDNFYAKQHPDGFICREIRESDGVDRFSRFDPAGTGPNILAFTEWEYFVHTGCRDRLRRVLDPLLAFHAWNRKHRTWPDGSYWATGWSSGMDNQPRLPPRAHVWYDHGHFTWVDACAQAVLSARRIGWMLRELGGDPAPFEREAEALGAWINAHLWSETTGFYHDRGPAGTLVENVRSAGAYWLLEAGVVPPERLERFCGHLEDPSAFHRPHRVPALAADSPGYNADGGYWCGGVWPPLTYVIVSGLRTQGKEDLAYRIACNHVEQVAAAFEATGTLWEYYAPELPGAGRGKPDFVGWTGLGPVALTIEEVLGVRTVGPARLQWRVRRLDEHGVLRLPVGADGVADLLCARRRDPGEAPCVSIRASVPVEIEVSWPGPGSPRRISSTA